MNSLQRVLAALQRRRPDRVPVVEFLVDFSVVRAAAPGCRDAADCMDHLDMDAVGCSAFFAKVRENSDGSYVDEWGVTYRPGPEAIAHPIAGPIATIDDARAWQPPPPDAPHRLGQLPELVRRYKGRRAIFFHCRAAFMWSAYLRGLDNLLMDFLADPELATVVLDKVLEANLAVARRAVRAGADVVVVTDDYAHNTAPMMSPAVFAEFLQPRLARMIELIHAEGALCIKHTDGNLYPILEQILSAGPDGLNPLEPVAGMDLATVKRLAGDRVCLIGNIDCGQLLPHGTVEQVREAVRRAIADAGDGGGYIVSSSNSIHSTCRPGNFVAMVRAAHEFGRYA